ncbi:MULTISPECIES: hypothetical protein [unclassified Paenibacillus]|uniref:hypothetical protein n=1 Tax=unclassified Paenibacillus TaxID=185978 RepID=UPI001C123980|nr:MULTISPECIES: hypothetical protein [unclassified Paenibacillus]MBU5444315.1 hypothetical protein [Paenibacillus sp. MSJ-34]CAH0121044.1 hypothetical protein PAE9249_03570 [Paenibacillus sp. CECT 9249]
MLHLLGQTCVVMRAGMEFDEYGTPYVQRWNEIGTYPCRLRRKRIGDAERAAPRLKAKETYMLYLPVWAQIDAGDVVAVSGYGGRYRALAPYRPGGHHTEAQIERESGL